MVMVVVGWLVELPRVGEGDEPAHAEASQFLPMLIQTYSNSQTPIGRFLPVETKQSFL